MNLILERQIKTYKDLKFWQTAKKVSLLIITLSKKLPSERLSWIVVDQVMRSSFSVGACIAEGFGKYKGKEYPRFIQIALGSAQETEYWLDLLSEAYPQFEDEISDILSLNLETIKMLTATLNSLRKNVSKI